MEQREIPGNPFKFLLVSFLVSIPISIIFTFIVREDQGIQSTIIALILYMIPITFITYLLVSLAYNFHAVLSKKFHWKDYLLLPVIVIIVGTFFTLKGTIEGGNLMSQFFLVFFGSGLGLFLVELIVYFIKKNKSQIFSNPSQASMQTQKQGI